MNYFVGYAIGFLICILLSIVRLGYENSDGLEPFINGTVYVCQSFLWPIVLVAYVVIGIITFPYHFGKWLRGFRTQHD
jgi:hypothetical protein